MTEPMCEQTVIDRSLPSWKPTVLKPCPNRARWRVVAAGWTMLMCGTHGNPYDRQWRIGDRFGLRAVERLSRPHTK